MPEVAYASLGIGSVTDWSRCQVRTGSGAQVPFHCLARILKGFASVQWLSLSAVLRSLVLLLKSVASSHVSFHGIPLEWQSKDGETNMSAIRTGSGAEQMWLE
jgi:hypothetical protein